MNPFSEFWNAISAQYPFPPYNGEWQKENNWYSATFWPQESVDYDALLEYRDFDMRIWTRRFLQSIRKPSGCLV